MEDNLEEHNIEKEPSENQANYEPENTAESVPAGDSEPITETQETENMEVHHHTHTHGKKNWKSYLWEFLMLFLAVFCGFLAEYKLEHVIEHNREKEFIRSMIEDAQIDTATIPRALKQIKVQVRYADSLFTVLYNYDPATVSDYSIYRYYRQLIGAIETVKPTERTLSQLKNAGGMRLIRSKAAADAIIYYDGAGKDVVAQQEFIDQVSVDIWRPATEIFNFKYYNPGTYIGMADDPILLSHDKAKFIHFANMMTAYGGGQNIFQQKLEDMLEKAINLITVLRKEYHLKDE